MQHTEPSVRLTLEEGTARSLALNQDPPIHIRSGMSPVCGVSCAHAVGTCRVAAVHVREWEDWPDFLSLPESCVVSSLQHRESSHSSDTNGDFCGIIEGVGLHSRKGRHETQWGLGILKGLPWEGKVRLGPRVRGRMHRSKPGGWGVDLVPVWRSFLSVKSVLVAAGWLCALHSGC